MAISIIGLVWAKKLGKELLVDTVKELAQKIARKHYLQVRTNPQTVNKAKIIKKVKELLSKDLNLDEAVFTE